MSRDLHLRTMSVNLPDDLIHRVRKLGFDENLSASSIVEQALIAFLDVASEADLVKVLRDRGATLRRG